MPTRLAVGLDQESGPDTIQCHKPLPRTIVPSDGSPALSLGFRASLGCESVGRVMRQPDAFVNGVREGRRGSRNGDIEDGATPFTQTTDPSVAPFFPNFPSRVAGAPSSAPPPYRSPLVLGSQLEPLLPAPLAPQANRSQTIASHN